MALGDVSVAVGPEKLSTPIFTNGRYKNPWSTWWDFAYFRDMRRFYTDRDKSAIPKKEEELDKTLPVLKPDLKEFEKFPESGIRHMWIGHASSLVQFNGVTFLTDPVFSDRCGPSQWIGPKRYRPPACIISELPKVDFVVISHSHYDHLDYTTVKTLNARFGAKLRWYVPMGLKRWMNDSDCTNVVEMTWWQEHLHSQESGVKVVCTPCQHTSQRSLWDKDKTLWSSWCVLGLKQKFFFGGDTGYCEAFKEIGQKYGPFDLATIPIGAYSPRIVMKPHHLDPEQAIAVHKEIKSRQSIGIHWGTFKLAHEFYLEPKLQIVELLEKHGLLPSSFVTVAFGDIQVFGGSDVSNQQ